MTVFVATSKRFYEEAEALVDRLKNAGEKVHHPYFHLDPAEIDGDAQLKSQVTIQHFPEIDDSDIFYALLPGGVHRLQRYHRIDVCLRQGKKGIRV